jgi:hypothetical protein
MSRSRLVWIEVSASWRCCTVNSRRSGVSVVKDLAVLGQRDRRALGGVVGALEGTT